VTGIFVHERKRKGLAPYRVAGIISPLLYIGLLSITVLRRANGNSGRWSVKDYWRLPVDDYGRGPVINKGCRMMINNGRRWGNC